MCFDILLTNVSTMLSFNFKYSKYFLSKCFQNTHHKRLLNYLINTQDVYTFKCE